MSVQFFYKGFTQDGNQRRYSFDAVEERQPVRLCAIRIELSLFTKYALSLQSGPMFCLQLLRRAAEGGVGHMEQFQEYCAVDTDFNTLTSERAARAAVVAAKKPPRRPFRKPAPASQLRGVGRPETADHRPAETVKKP